MTEVIRERPPAGRHPAAAPTPQVERADRAAVEGFLADFEPFARERAGEPGFVAAERRRAIERFAELGFPTTRQEEWRFTNLLPIARSRFTRPGAARPVEREAVLGHAFAAGSRLTFVDGRFAPELSSLSGLPAGVVVASLAHVLATDPGRLEAHLGRHARLAQHPFVALNAAFFFDGAYVEIPRGVVVEEPIQLLFFSRGLDGGPDAPAAGQNGARPPVFHPRNLIVAGEASQSIVIETYAGRAAAAERYFTCAVTELVAGPGAVVDHSKLQKESAEAFHLATLQFYQERGSNLFSHSIAIGGGLVRNDVNAALDGEGVECTLNGLYVLRGSQFLDNHMRVDHLKPHGTSFELFKGILEGKSRAVFNGRIFVAKGAQKTDAKQSSRNLLLSKEALVNANPQLEIFADDVKCTHGSTVGQLDDDAIFYLRTRGIGEEAARSLLTYAFASDIVERIRVEPVRRELTEFLFSRLPRGEVVRQAV
jgi:Fe-S cluster assembly protein SufD